MYVPTRLAGLRSTAGAKQRSGTVNVSLIRALPEASNGTGSTLSTTAPLQTRLAEIVVTGLAFVAVTSRLRTLASKRPSRLTVTALELTVQSTPPGLTPDNGASVVRLPIRSAQQGAVRAMMIIVAAAIGWGDQSQRGREHQAGADDGCASESGHCSPPR